MSKMVINTPKGFRDFLGKEARKRQSVLNILTQVFERFGFEPLLTPALEYAEVLKGKYGEEEKLIYEFEDRGGRQVALRYDQTVPLSRVIASYPNLTKPYKRYQIQPVWRAENPQKGRYREFVQVDFDTVGSASLLADAEVIACAVASLEELGFEKFTVRVNDREIFANLPNSVIAAIDKIDKIGKEGVFALIKAQNYSDFQTEEILKKITESTPTQKINQLFDFLDQLKVNKNACAFDPSLARGLDYYTGLIFEIEVEGYTAGSIGGGGRYDKLISLVSENTFPAVGFSFGFDRIMEALETVKPSEVPSSGTVVLVTIFNPEFLNASLEAAATLRNSGINTEIYLDPEAKLEKQMKYADQKSIPFALIIGPDEIKEKVVTLKNLRDRKQEKIKISQIKSKF